MSKPLCIDLFCGLGGWAQGFLAEGYDVVGFDIERHEYWMPESMPDAEGCKGTKPLEKRGWTQGCAITLGMEGANSQPRTRLEKYPAQLVLQDVLTLSGRQFRNAAVIVASPPCQEYSYMAMPWSKAKAKAQWYREDVTRQLALNCLFNACFRIAHEAQVPLIVENVRGAQPWVGRAKWNFGSFYLWGDLPALMPQPATRKLKGGDRNKNRADGQSAAVEGMKNDGSGWLPNGTLASCNRMVPDGLKCGGDWFNDKQPPLSRLYSSKSPARKAASAQIAKIPFALAQHIAQVFKPASERCA